jgi:hypothetical protein
MGVSVIGDFRQRCWLFACTPWRAFIQNPRFPPARENSCTHGGPVRFHAPSMGILPLQGSPPHLPSDVVTLVIRGSSPVHPALLRP